VKNAKPFRLDSTRLSESDDLVLLCLPYWFQNLLLDMTERMLWSRVWVTEFGTEITLTEYDRDKIEYAIWLLSQEECNMVINVTTGDNTQTVNTGGGGSGGGSCPPTVINVYPPQSPMCLPISGTPGGEIPPMPDVPPGTVPPPYGEGDPTYPTPEDYNAAHCKVANWGWQLIFDWLDKLSNVDNNIVAVAVAIAAIVAHAPVAILSLIASSELIMIAVRLLELRAYAEITDAVFDDIKQYWVDNREDITCRMYNTTSPSTTSNTIKAEMLDFLTLIWQDRPGWTDAMIAAAANMERVIMPGSIFWRFINSAPPEGWSGGIDCAACNTPEVDGLWAFDRVYVADGSETFLNIPGDDGFSLVGEWVAGTVTDVRVRIQRDIADAGDLATWSAITFACTISGSGGIMTYGAEGHTTPICDLDDVGGITNLRFAIHRSGYPVPAGTYDEVITVPSEDYLLPYVLIGKFTFHPPNLIVAMQLENWQHYIESPL